MNRKAMCKQLMAIFCVVAVAILNVAVARAATAYDNTAFTLSGVPLFLSQRALPLVMLDVSRDHQLYFKAYDDYSDINRDGIPDTTYKDGIDYYGYFDSKKCYIYSSTNGRFEPSSLITSTTDHYCDNSVTANKWSGNFLNWATMTRIDTVRKILYGGYRSTDTATDTTLERSFLPNDAHSFAKYYNGTDTGRLTPFTSVATGAANTSATGITICNTTVNSDGNALSQNVTSAPLMRIAQGNFSLWAANERWQCRWSSEKSESNGNDFLQSGLYARSGNPTAGTDGLSVSGVGPDFNVRVQVCANSALIGGEVDHCKVYPDGNLKPVGLLQEYGDTNEIQFGLMTGSFGKNKSGGVLRRQLGNISNEVNVSTNGTFVTSTLTGGSILQTLNALKIYGYNFGDGTYFGTTGADNCSWGLSSFSDGSCSNWGNPQSEMYLEALRYLAGKTPNSDFAPAGSLFTSPASVTVDKSEPFGLGVVSSWAAPVTSANYCAGISLIQFNASASSYDSDQLGGASDLGISSLSSLTDAVGTVEGITGSKYFVGETPADNNQLCTAKTINNLSTAKGTCPDAPRLGGSYQVAGLAHYARTEDLMSSVQDAQTVKTFGVALSPAVPRVAIDVPGLAGKKITIQPACRNTTLSPAGNCAVVDFKIVTQSSTSTANSGKLYVNWEDSEQGGDFDQDMWGVISYTVTGASVTITTDVIAQSTPNEMGFGYVVGGTTSDGFYVHSGINNFDYTAPAAIPSGAVINGCSDCGTSDSATTNIYVIGSSDAKPLEQPLFYASKWGAFNDSDNSKTPNVISEWDADADGIPDSYFYATNPAELEASLNKAFEKVSRQVGSGSALSANSTRLDLGTVVYQAKLDSTDWSGQLQAYTLTNSAALGTLLWDASASAWPLNSGNHRITSVSARKIFTTVSGTASPLSSSTSSQLLLLRASGETDNVNAAKRIEWLRGDQSNEQPSGILRERPYDVAAARTTLLGDIVNSDPVYSGAQNFHYELLPTFDPDGTTATGAASYASYVDTKKYNVATSTGRVPTVFVSANDGMLHAFNAITGAELFAYMPSQALAKSIALTKPNYGTPANPHQYFVDGLSFVGDAYDKTTNTWKTILVGSLGGGGRGVFVLDVTDPTNFNASKVLFELTNADEPRLGYVLGQPLIARMADGRWAAIFGNGYSSTGGNSSLFIVDVFNKANRVVIDTDTRANNGLSAPALLVDGNNTVIAAYAGDLQGQLWKFDLSATTNVTSGSGWASAYKSGATGQPMFIARGPKLPDGEVQPITAEPTLGLNPKKGNVVMVYFGTGRYVATNDVALPTPAPVQSFYGIADTGSVITTVDRSSLKQKTMTTSGATRAVTEGTINWSSWNGWYLDLSASTGERVTSKAILAYDRVLFTTLIPSQAQCGSGGSGWLMEVSGVGDDSSTYKMFIDSSALGGGGKYFNVSIVKTPVIVTTGTDVYVMGNRSDGTFFSDKGKGPLGKGRMSWRQLK